MSSCFFALLVFKAPFSFDDVKAVAFGIANHVDDDVKQERYDRLMALQQGISLKKNQSSLEQFTAVEHTPAKKYTGPNLPKQ